MTTFLLLFGVIVLLSCVAVWVALRCPSCGSLDIELVDGYVQHCRFCGEKF